jgi:hypothetical protein
MINDSYIIIQELSKKYIPSKFGYWQVRVDFLILDRATSRASRGSSRNFGTLLSKGSTVKDRGGPRGISSSHKFRLTAYKENNYFLLIIVCVF